MTRLRHTSTLPDHDPERVFAWHERPGALERLTPPWVQMRVIEPSGGIRDGARVLLEVRWGPASVAWELRHSGYVAGREFRDEQVSGPMKRWSHTHRFLPAPGGGTILEDEIEFEAPLGWAGAAVAPEFIRGEMERVMRFRHHRLARDLARHPRGSSDRPLTIAITGSSGMIGTSLRHFLTTGGHSVLRLVRSRDETGDDVVFWDPDRGEIDRERLARADAVVHLAGTPIAPGRWTDDRKRSILESRIRGTELIASALAQLPGPRRVLVSSSAVGYYGNRGEESLDEGASSGDGFLAEVCRRWEGATLEAERAGIRVVHLRTGVVLSPAGGALAQMLLPFKMGAGGKIGSGRQFMSWIDLDDLLALVLHAILTPELRGPVNATAPEPVTNATFTATLGRVLGRPAVVPLPALGVKAAFGQMGEEALLFSQRALPTRALASGFRFDLERVEDALRFQLGREVGPDH